VSMPQHDMSAACVRLRRIHRVYTPLVDRPRKDMCRFRTDLVSA
jgi:hypothetical protein